MHRWIIGVVLLAACGGGVPSSNGDVVNRIGDSVASMAVPTRLLQPDSPLCTSGALACDVPPGGGGVVAPDGSALVRVVGGRSSIVALVRAGSDSAVAFGREGAGPGEYRSPVEIELDSAGNVCVFDLFTRRLLRFAADGSPAATGIAQLPPAPQPAMRFVDGALWMLSAENPSAKGDTLETFVYAVTDAAAAQQRHALELRLESYGLGEFRPMTLTLGAAPQFALGRDGRVVYSAGVTAELALYDASGRLTVRGGFNAPGREVTEEDVEAAIVRQMRGIPPGQMRDQLLQRMRASADRHPGVTQLLVMSDGAVWAREAPEADTDSVAWLVYTADLTPRARIRVGVDDRPVGTHGERVLLARSGEDESSTGYWWMRER